MQVAEKLNITRNKILKISDKCKANKFVSLPFLNHTQVIILAVNEYYKTINKYIITLLNKYIYKYCY